MSGFTENRAYESDEQLERSPVVVNLGTARRMLPLLRRVLGDFVKYNSLLQQLLAEQEQLDQQRHTLDWPKRQRRYQVHEEVLAARRELEDARAELEVLGVVLEDAELGQVGLPTVVNGRLAYFSWRPTEVTVSSWHFPGETLRRPIPAGWSETSPVQLKSRS